MLKSISFKQRGDFLIESMIGVLLMGIVGAGVTFTTSRVSVSQQQMAMQEIVVSNLRGMLLANGSGFDICDQTPYVYLPNDEALRVQVTGCNADATATIAGVDLANVQTPIVLTVNSPSLGEIRVGGQL